MSYSSVYEKADAEKMLYTILSDVMTFSEDQAAVMTLEDRKDAEQLLWAELNKKQSEKTALLLTFYFKYNLLTLASSEANLLMLSIPPLQPPLVA